MHAYAATQSLTQAGDLPHLGMSLDTYLIWDKTVFWAPSYLK